MNQGKKTLVFVLKTTLSLAPSSGIATKIAKLKARNEKHCTKIATMVIRFQLCSLYFHSIIDLPGPRGKTYYGQGCQSKIIKKMRNYFCGKPVYA